MTWAEDEEYIDEEKLLDLIANEHIFTFKAKLPKEEMIGTIFFLIFGFLFLFLGFTGIYGLIINSEIIIEKSNIALATPVTFLGSSFTILGIVVLVMGLKSYDRMLELRPDMIKVNKRDNKEKNKQKYCFKDILTIEHILMKKVKADKHTFFEEERIDFLDRDSYSRNTTRGLNRSDRHKFVLHLKNGKKGKIKIDEWEVKGYKENYQIIKLIIYCYFNHFRENNEKLIRAKNRSK